MSRSGLDPIKDTVDGTSGSNEYAAIFDTLVRYDPIANKYVPQLAEGFRPMRATRRGPSSFVPVSLSPTERLWMLRR